MNEQTTGGETQTKETRQEIGQFTFSQALEKLKEGNFIYRKGWNGENQRLKLQTPDENSKMTLPYIYIQTVQGDLVPWIASQTDILADDWYFISPSDQSSAVGS